MPERWRWRCSSALPARLRWRHRQTIRSNPSIARSCSSTAPSTAWWCARWRAATRAWRPRRFAPASATSSTTCASRARRSISCCKAGRVLPWLTRHASLVNSTLGIGGLFDPAARMGLPRHREDFGQTFAAWGIESGAYLMIPFVGSSNVRDTIGMVVGLGAMPQTYIDLPPRAGLTAMWVIRQRSENLQPRRANHRRSLCVPARSMAEAARRGDRRHGAGIERSSVGSLAESDLGARASCPRTRRQARRFGSKALAHGRACQRESGSLEGRHSAFPRAVRRADPRMPQGAFRRQGRQNAFPPEESRLDQRFP